MLINSNYKNRFCYIRTAGLYFFFFNDPPTTEIYTLSLHDALPISQRADRVRDGRDPQRGRNDARAGERQPRGHRQRGDGRSEEHTSELQSRRDLVCRLLLEKKNKKSTKHQKTNSKCL